MIEYLKKEIRHIPFLLLVTIIVYSVGTFATNYLLEAAEVTFDDTNTTIQASDVDEAIDSIYDYVTDYTDIDTRLTNVENKIGNTALTTTQQTLAAAINEVRSMKANLSGATFTGNVQVKGMPSVATLYFYDADGDYVGRINAGPISNKNRVVVSVSNKNAQYYTNYTLPASTASGANVVKNIATINTVSGYNFYSVGDSITLPQCLFGIGIGSSSLRFIQPVPRQIPTGKVYTLSFSTISNVYKDDGTTVTITDMSCTASVDASGNNIIITCTGVSGITSGGLYTMVLSDSNTLTIENA